MPAAKLSSTRHPSPTVAGAPTSDLPLTDYVMTREHRSGDGMGRSSCFQVLQPFASISPCAARAACGVVQLLCCCSCACQLVVSVLYTLPQVHSLPQGRRVARTMVEDGETQQQPFTEDEVSQMHEKVRELAQQRLTDKDELTGWSGKLNSELQEISDLQEQGSRLRKALKQPAEGAEAAAGRGRGPSIPERRARGGASGGADAASWCERGVACEVA